MKWSINNTQNDMKKIFLILLLATNCYAEPFRYDKPTICDDVKEVLKMIEEYKEKIIFSLELLS